MSKGKTNVPPLRGDVWIVDLDPIIGHEQGGIRPVLVVSEDRFNRSQAGLIMITAITTTERGLNVHIAVDPPEGGLTKPSFIMTDQVRAISKLRLGRRIGTIASDTMAAVEDRLRYLLRL
ncbi:MAG: type II toxin-antitoxin system PemK/MazF family toxin [Isosphaeraceae bacterium]